VARSIAGILSGGQYQSVSQSNATALTLLLTRSHSTLYFDVDRKQRNTAVGFIKNMDFSYQLQAGRPYVDFTVTAVAGHLTSSDFTDQHRKWNSCDPFALFDAPITRFVSKVGGQDFWTGLLQSNLADAIYRTTTCKESRGTF
jgi:DNA topoisomerase-3